MTSPSPGDSGLRAPRPAWTVARRCRRERSSIDQPRIPTMSTAQSIGQATKLTSRRELGDPRHDAVSTTDRHPLVGIIILNWNRPEHTTACLQSISRLDYPAFQTVVVDNGSTDGSPSLIRQQFPAVALIENGR